MTYPFSFPNTYASGQKTNADSWQEDLDALQAVFPLGPDFFSNGVFVKCVFTWDEKIPIWAFPPEIAKRKNRSPDPEAPPLGGFAFDPLFINSFNLLYERAFADEIKPAANLKRVGRVTGALRSTVPLALLVDNENFSIHQVTWDGDATGGKWKLYSTAEIRQYYATLGTPTIWTIVPGGEDGELVKGFDPDVDFIANESLFGFQQMYLADSIRLKNSKIIALGSIRGGGNIWDIDGSTATVSLLTRPKGGLVAGTENTLKPNAAKLYPNYNGEFVYVFASGWMVPSVGGANWDPWNSQRIRMRKNSSSQARDVTVFSPGAAPFIGSGSQPRGMDGTVVYPYARQETFERGTTSLVVVAAGNWDNEPTLISAYIGDHGEVEESATTSPTWENLVPDLPNQSSVVCIQNFRTYLFIVTSNSSGLHWALTVPRPGSGGNAVSVCSGTYTTGKGTDWQDAIPRSSSCDGDSIYLMLDNGKIWRWDLRLAARAAGSQGEVFTPRGNSVTAGSEELFEIEDDGIYDPRGRFWGNTSFALNGVIANRFSNTGDGDTTVVAPVR